VNRFHLVPCTSHRDIHRDGTQLTLEAIHGMPLGVNNQVTSYTLDTEAGVTYKQPSLNLPSSSLIKSSNLGTATNNTQIN